MPVHMKDRRGIAMTFDKKPLYKAYDEETCLATIYSDGSLELYRDSGDWRQFLLSDAEISWLKTLSVLVKQKEYLTPFLGELVWGRYRLESSPDLF